MALKLQPPLKPEYVQLGKHGGTYEVRKTDLPCVVCHKEIQPGQLYVPSDIGPRHLGC